MTPACTVRVDRTWDGRPVGPDATAEIRLFHNLDALRIELEAPFHDDPPPPAPVGATDGLWRYEVVEIFIAERDVPDEAVRYTEIELSPHGHHLVLTLVGVRRIISCPHPMRFRARIDGRRWHGSAALACDFLPPPPWSVGAFAIHGTGAARRYLAATALPGAAPDFHQPACFTPLDPIRSAT